MPPDPPVDPFLEERPSSSPIDVLYTAVFIATAIYGGVQEAPWWIPAFAGFCAGIMFAAILFDAGVLGKRNGLLGEAEEPVPARSDEEVVVTLTREEAEALIDAVSLWEDANGPLDPADVGRHGRSKLSTALDREET